MKFGVPRKGLVEKLRPTPMEGASSKCNAAHTLELQTI